MLDALNTSYEPRMLRRELIPFLSVVTIAALLLTWRLGAVYLWQDEAATAVLAERSA